MTHCTCDACQRDRELLELAREFLPMLIMLARAQAMAGTTISNKWREMEGETKFRRMNEKKVAVIENVV